ncbi:kinase-like domain-containing protein [Desarmillaria tabescens]|uniref:non-specific serine/threonine protein kinase n=1 Tax=Armillaria tabescens TaxID=1929756 RepID=A0AA39K652_ARMTA|nr:kinase-like domain-containing protein [Desarmillaria tabescens]KAK0455215.1 kinase-like domain-containing protein [Desarmillaria tabescens]
MILRKLASPIPKSHYTDLDPLSLSSVPSPSISPSPCSTSPASNSQSKTHAFFASPFSTRPSSPVPPTKRNTDDLDLNGNGNKPNSKRSSAAPRSLTADFFATTATSPTISVQPKSKRNFLNLDLLRYAPNVDGTAQHPSSLATNFTSTPTPTSIEYPDMSSEPTPRPPALKLKLSPNLMEPASMQPSPLSLVQPVPPPPGTQEDAEVLPSSASISSSVRSDDTSDVYDELAPGMIIRSFLPGHSSSSSSVKQTPTPTTSFPSSDTLSPLKSDPHPAGDPAPGDVSLRLKRALGKGAFSNVWLAEDLSPTPLLLKTKKSLRHLKRKAEAASSGKLKHSRSSSSLMKRLRGGVSGTRPHNGSPTTSPNKYGNGLGVGHTHPIKDRISSSSSVRSIYLDEKDGDGVSPDAGTSLSRASSISWQSVSSSDSDGVGSVHRSSSTRSARIKRAPKLVAVKLTLRGSIEVKKDAYYQAEEERERDRMRVSFVREVEVLKASRYSINSVSLASDVFDVWLIFSIFQHISHPNITPLLSHLTTRTHHLLVLPYCSGGDLLELVTSESWHVLDESIVKRIWVEVCRAVGWMHGVGLVHRDIKLENILLTVPLSSSMIPKPPQDPYDTDASHSPLSLPTPPLPLIQLTDFGLSRFIDPSRPLLTTRCGSEAYAAPELVISGGRSTVASGKSKWGDYAEADGGGYDARETDAWACGVALYEIMTRLLPFGEGPSDGKPYGRAKFAGTPSERRQWLIKIARAEWKWPEGSKHGDGEESIVECTGARRMVERLLVRDPSKRSRIIDLWDDEWMSGLVSPPPSGRPSMEKEADKGGYSVRVNVWRDSQRLENGQYEDDFREDGLDEEEMLENEVDTDGWIVDKEGIGSIASEEVQ